MDDRSIKTQIRQRVRDRAYKALAARGLEHLKRRIPLAAITQHLLSTLPDLARRDGLSAWHVDHVQPLAAFALDVPAQLAAAFAPANHRWLGAHANLSKGATYDPRQAMRAVYLHRLRRE